MGRPTKLNADTQRAIVQALQSGAYLETAAAYAGINPATLHRWLKRGADEIARRERIDEEKAREKIEDKDRQRAIRVEERTRRKQRDADDRKARRREAVYVAFREAIEKALADSEIAALGIIGAAARGRMLKARTVTRDVQTGAETVSETYHRSEWTAAAWLLERRHPKRYGRATRLEHTGADGGPVAVSWVDAVKEAIATDRALRTSNGNGNGNGNGGRALQLPAPAVLDADDTADA